MQEKLVSVVMPTYNCGDFIAESINSVINQSYMNWELLIIDDVSDDQTAKVIEENFNDKRIRYFCLSKNSGAAVARSFGINQSRGSYIAFLDSDDLWEKEKLAKQTQFMQDHDYAFSFTAYKHINEQGNCLDKVVTAQQKVNYNGVLFNCPIGNSSVIYDVEKLGKFEIPNIRKRNDDALWLKILKKEKYAYGLNEVLMQYRIRKNSLSRNKLELVKYHWYLYREIEKFSVFRSVWHIFCWGGIKILGLK